MRYVGEREVCYDPNELGFPSIMGCHAIVLVNANGLFGFHNYGGERATDWPASLPLAKPSLCSSRRPSPASSLK